MDKLTLTMLDYAKGMYAIAAGVATTESLMGGPPSTDLEYVLPGAKSALTFAYALDRGAIERFLAKEDREAHQRDNFLVNAQASGAALWMARYLEQLGYPSYALAANNVYRADPPYGRLAMLPDISLRYWPSVPASVISVCPEM